ncbi:MAG: hypothetical protein SNG97_06905 [Rikenellaceae bacterium]
MNQMITKNQNTMNFPKTAVELKMFVFATLASAKVAKDTTTLIAATQEAYAALGGDDFVNNDPLTAGIAPIMEQVTRIMGGEHPASSGAAWREQRAAHFEQARAERAAPKQCQCAKEEEEK